MLPRRRCPFCRRWFHPHPRLKQRQKTCGRPDCRHKQKQKSNQEWRTENPDYFPKMARAAEIVACKFHKS